MYEEMSLNELVLYVSDYVSLSHFNFILSSVNSGKELITTLLTKAKEKHWEYNGYTAKCDINDIDNKSNSLLITISHMYTYCGLPLNTMYNQFSIELAKELGVNVNSIQENLFNGVYQAITEPAAMYNGQTMTLSQKLTDLRVILNEYKAYSVQYLKHYLSL